MIMHICGSGHTRRIGLVLAISGLLAAGSAVQALPGNPGKQLFHEDFENGLADGARRRRRPTTA
jgi:hypothetical protein